jgi:hypothetical protein
MSGFSRLSSEKNMPHKPWVFAFAILLLVWPDREMGGRTACHVIGERKNFTLLFVVFTGLNIAQKAMTTKRILPNCMKGAI